MSSLLLTFYCNSVNGFIVHRAVVSPIQARFAVDAPKEKTVEDNDNNNQSEDEVPPGQAATGTVNERLMAELEQAAQTEKYGNRSSVAKKMGLSAFGNTKTDEERRRAIEEARDLNGVNPVVAITGSLFALAAAWGLWTLTQFLADYFAMHPIDESIYFVARLSSVFRNVIVGLVSLASGFFGVTGMGILALGIRVAYGVATGELDPTPLEKSKEEKEAVDLGNVWNLMANKNQKRGRR